MLSCMEIMKTHSSQRIVGYDLARCLAIVGMVIVNFKIVMHVTSAGAPPWLALFDLVDGRASALFVILAGCGLTLMSARARAQADTALLRADQVIIWKRAAFLFAAGLLYIGVWPADILHFYGVYLAIGACALAWRTRTVLLAAIGMMLGFVLLAALMPYETGWNWDTLSYAGFWSPAGFARNLMFNGFHPVFPWAGFLLLGIALARLDLQDPATRRAVFGLGAGIAAAAETAAWAGAKWLAAGGGVWSHLWQTGPLPPLPLYWLGAGGAAVAILCLCIGLGARFGHSAWLAPAIHTGQLALTLYVAHVVVGMGTLEALGRLDGQTLGFALASALAFCAGAVVFAHLWRRRFRLGPLEWLMRRCAG